MSDTVPREWRFYLDDMLDFAGDNDTLWSIIRDDVPELLERLESLKLKVTT